MAIITLGVGFFAGIKATAPSMYQLAETYYREKRLMDFRLVSTVGFAEEDIQAVAETEGVQSVMPSYFCDVMTSADDGGDIVRLIALPKAYQSNRTLNTLTINEGRSVRRSGEIITESVAFANARHKVGATVTFAPTAGDNKLTELLNVSELAAPPSATARSTNICIFPPRISSCRATRSCMSRRRFRMRSPRFRTTMHSRRHR